jgi:two-component system, NtrC family, response regulator AtoC
MHSKEGPMIRKIEIKKRLLDTIKNNKPVIGVATGCGFSSKQAINGGADLLLVLNAGRFRSYGIPSIGGMLPFSNSNDTVMEFGTREILTRVKDAPVLFGVCATDPTIPSNILLNNIINNGFSGVVNFPTVGLIDGKFREALEENDLGFYKEVEFLKGASERGLFTIAFVFNVVQAEEMAKAGVDIICAHLGWTIGGENSIKQRVNLKEGAVLSQEIFDAASTINKDLLFMVYGGPIHGPEEANFYYSNTKAVGYIGGSTFERIPSELSISETTEKFKNLIYLQKENEYLKKELLKQKGFEDIIGQSDSMQEIYEIVRRVADRNINVLIQGESGTGKELIAKAIHFNSQRFNKPLIKLNCAALSEGLLESELFGHEKGAFTGATRERLGRFELANKGTLFLDEIGEMNPSTQAKLLRAIQQQEFERVGGSKTIKVDVRIISATNVNLKKAVEEGRFREDLYYRLNVIAINLPPLKKRKEDIPLLINGFLKKINKNYGRNIKRLTSEALDIFVKYDWPGNVRELENILSRAAVLTDGDILELRDVITYFPNSDQKGESIYGMEGRANYTLKAAKELERQHLIESLKKFNWSRTKTSEYLGITRRTLFNRMKSYGIEEE